MKKSLIFSLAILLILAACAPAPGQIPQAPGEPGSTTGIGQAISATDRGNAWAGHLNPTGELVFSIGVKSTSKTNLFELSSSTDSTKYVDARAVTCNEDLDVVLQFSEPGSLVWNTLYSLQNVNGVEKWVAIDLLDVNGNPKFGISPEKVYTDENGNKWIQDVVNADLKISKDVVAKSLDGPDPDSDGIKEKGKLYVAAYSCKNYGSGIQANWQCGCDETSPKDTLGKPTSPCGSKWRIQDIDVGDTPSTGDTKQLYRYMSTDGFNHYTFATDACNKPTDIKAGETMNSLVTFYSESADISKKALPVYICDGGKYITTNPSDTQCTDQDKKTIQAYYPSATSGNNQPFYLCTGKGGNYYTASQACDGNWGYSLTKELPNVIGVVEPDAQIDFVRCNAQGSFHYLSLDGETCYGIDTGVGIKTGTLESVQGKIYKYAGVDRVALNECRNGLEAPYIQTEECLGTDIKKHIVGYAINKDVTDVALKANTKPIYRCTNKQNFNTQTGAVIDSFITANLGCEASRNHYGGESFARVFKNTDDTYAFDGQHTLYRCNNPPNRHNDVLSAPADGQPCSNGGTLEGPVANLFNEKLNDQMVSIYQCWANVDSSRTKLSLDKNCPDIDNLENKGSHLMGYVYKTSTTGYERPLISCRSGDDFFTTNKVNCEGQPYGFGVLGYISGQYPVNTDGSKTLTFDSCRWVGPTVHPTTTIQVLGVPVQQVQNPTNTISLQPDEFIVAATSSTYLVPSLISQIGLTNEGKIFASPNTNKHGSSQIVAVKVCKTNDLKWSSTTPVANTRNSYCTGSGVPADFQSDSNGGTRGFGITTKCVTPSKTLTFVSEVDGNHGRIYCPPGTVATGIKALATDDDYSAGFSLYCAKP